MPIGDFLLDSVQSNWMALPENLYLSPSRVYSAELGRFIQRDPLPKVQVRGELGVYGNSIFAWEMQVSENQNNTNLYSYVFGNPINSSDYLGLVTEAQQHDHCEKQRKDWEKRLRDTKSTIGKFWAKLAQGKDCKIPPIICECCKGDNINYGGYWSNKDKKVYICENNLPANVGWSEFGRRFTHELIHAAQALCFKWKGGSCKDSVCKEIQAYSYEHRGLKTGKGRTKAKILKGVLTSSFNACAREVVNPWNNSKSVAQNAKGKEDEIKQKIKNEFNAVYDKCKGVIGKPKNLAE